MKTKMACKYYVMTNLLEYLDTHTTYALTTRAHTRLQQAMRLQIIHIHSGPLQLLHGHRNLHQSQVSDPDQTCEPDTSRQCLCITVEDQLYPPSPRTHHLP
jgi:hypothetical protein